jgi:hypothetical protein
VVNPNLEDQKYFSIMRSAKNKINIAKIRTNSHELHSESECWAIPKIGGMKESAIFVTLRGLNMKTTSS